MPNTGHARPNRLAGLAKVLLTLAVVVASGSAPAQTSLEDLVSAVVRIKTFINPDGRTIETLGREREGSGIVIDEDGLVLTIGYLMVEAHAAEVVTNASRTVPATSDTTTKPASACSRQWSRSS
jgi:S1-C subfamily serine protease